MKLNVELSFGKSDKLTKTFILKWNPAISSYTMARLNEDLRDWVDGFDPDFDWSVWDWQNAKCGDRFFMVRVGDGNTGVIGAGYFTSDPFESEDWSGRGRKVYYMKMEFDEIIHPDRAPILDTATLQQAIPNYDWTKGHSGEMLDKESAFRLENLWNAFVVNNISVFEPRAYRRMPSCDRY